jgi:hypothetical protein
MLVGPQLWLGVVLMVGMQVSHTTPVRPFLSTDFGSGFVVGCSNPGPAATDVPPSAEVRIDGRLQERLSGGFRGAVTPFLPGDKWEELVTLHTQQPRTVGTLGFRVSRTLVVDLAPGPHTIAFACGQAWSDDISFYWQRNVSPNGTGVSQ